MIHQLPSRSALAALFHGECVELGVAGGAYSKEILSYGNCHLLWSIDRWNDHHDLKQYKAAALRLAQEGEGACIVLRMTFDEALPLFADESLDCIYVDAYAHTGSEDGQILRDWWPKLKRGGLFAGHDYHPKWPENIKAVDEFAAAHNFKFNLTGETAEGQYPSWFGWKE